MRRFGIIVWLFLPLLGGTVAAQEPAPDWAYPSPVFSLDIKQVLAPQEEDEDERIGGTTPPPDNRGMLERGFDASHDWVSDTVNNFASTIDGFFGDELEEEEFDASRVRIRLGYTLADYDRSEFVRKLRLKLRLPGTQKKLQLFVQGARDDSVGEGDSKADPIEDEPGLTTGFRYLVRATDAINLSVDVGAKFRFPPEPFVELRARRTFPLSDNWLVRPTQWVFWKTDEGFGETTRIDFDYKCFENSLLRFRQRATFSEETLGLEFGSSVLFYETVGSRRGFVLRASAGGQTRPELVMRKYELSVLLRKNIHRDRLFLEIEPFVTFFKEIGYRASPGISLVFEANFEPFRRDPSAKDE